MNNPFYIAKKEGKTENGAWYAILQDQANKFHVSVSVGNEAIYDCYTNPPSIEYLDEQVLKLEKELLNKKEVI
jgi:hypothetical protein